MSVVLNIENIIIKNTNKHKSLTKLKVNALKLDFKVLRLACQKFIKKNEVKPINSQPKNKVKKFSEITKIIILITKQFSQNKKPISSASFLK